MVLYCANVSVCKPTLNKVDCNSILNRTIVKVSHLQVARKLGLVKDKYSPVNDSSAKQDLKAAVVIRKRDASDTNRLPPPKPKRSGNYNKNLTGKTV